MKTVTRTEYYDFIKVQRSEVSQGIKIVRSIVFRFYDEHIVEKVFIFDVLRAQAVTYNGYESYFITEN